MAGKKFHVVESLKYFVVRDPSKDEDLLTSAEFGRLSVPSSRHRMLVVCECSLRVSANDICALLNRDYFAGWSFVDRMIGAIDRSFGSKEKPLLVPIKSHIEQPAAEFTMQTKCDDCNASVYACNCMPRQLPPAPDVDRNICIVGRGEGECLCYVCDVPF